MALFKSKQEKEIEKKMLIKRTINTMNKQINTLEEQKKVFVEKAKTAKKNGLDAQYNLALTGYKMTLLQQKRAQEMLLNFEITSQMKDMTMMTKEFLGGMSVLSKEMAKLADEKEFIKVQKQFELAMGNAERQAEQMDMFTDYAELDAERERENAALEREKRKQAALLKIKNKYGKNAVLRGMNFEEGATMRDRNGQIGGHKA